MSGQRHTSEATCPTCGNDEAIVRVRGNAFSSVCTVCRRADVNPLLDSIDLVLTEGETMEAELFELAAMRAGDASSVRTLTLSRQLIEDNTDESLRAYVDDQLRTAMTVELRLPVPPR